MLIVVMKKGKKRKNKENGNADPAFPFSCYILLPIYFIKLQTYKQYFRL